MTENFLEKLLEHNNWANRKIIQACYAWATSNLMPNPTLRHKEIFVIPCCIS